MAHGSIETVQGVAERNPAVHYPAELSFRVRIEVHHCVKHAAVLHLRMNVQLESLRHLQRIHDVRQVHGGTVQGIGQALMEHAVYDGGSGQLVAASLLDYALPRAADVPAIRFETRNVRCRTHPLGVKGAGEAGAIGSCPAVMNAVADALWRAYRIRRIDMPATPERVWAAIAEARRTAHAVNYF